MGTINIYHNAVPLVLSAELLRVAANLASVDPRACGFAGVPTVFIVTQTAAWTVLLQGTHERRLAESPGSEEPLRFTAEARSCLPLPVSGDLIHAGKMRFYPKTVASWPTTCCYLCSSSNSSSYSRTANPVN